jgi:hypothetical protein
MNPFYGVVLFMGEGSMTEVGVRVSSQMLRLGVYSVGMRRAIFRTSGYKTVIRRP